MMEARNRLQEYISRNEAMVKKIRMNEAKVLYKGDVHAKRLQEIGGALKKLNEMYETAQKELEQCVDDRREELRGLEGNFLESTAGLRDMLSTSEHFKYSNEELDSKLKPVDTEMKKGNVCIESATEFDLIIQPELMKMCQAVLQLEKPIYVRTANIYPEEVDVIMTPSVSSANNPKCAVVTVLAVPRHPVFGLDKLLTTTLECLNTDDAADLIGGPMIKGGATTMNNQNGCVKIVFGPVRAVGEYIVKVQLYGKSVNNSPMVARLESTAAAAEMLNLPRGDNVKRVTGIPICRSHSVSMNGGDHNGRSSPVRSGGSMLYALANRARTYSGSTATARGPVPSVAPKLQVDTSLQLKTKHSIHGTPV